MELGLSVSPTNGARSRKGEERETHCAGTDILLILNVEVHHLEQLMACYGDHLDQGPQVAFREDCIGY